MKHVVIFCRYIFTVTSSIFFVTKPNRDKNCQSRVHSKACSAITCPRCISLDNIPDISNSEVSKPRLFAVTKSVNSADTADFVMANIHEVPIIVGQMHIRQIQMVYFMLFFCNKFNFARKKWSNVHQNMLGLYKKGRIIRNFD